VSFGRAGFLRFGSDSPLGGRDLTGDRRGPRGRQRAVIIDDRIVSKAAAHLVLERRGPPGGRGVIFGRQAWALRKPSSASRPGDLPSSRGKASMILFVENRGGFDHAARDFSGLCQGRGSAGNVFDPSSNPWCRVRPSRRALSASTRARPDGRGKSALGGPDPAAGDGATRWRRGGPSIVRQAVCRSSARRLAACGPFV